MLNVIIEVLEMNGGNIYFFSSALRFIPMIVTTGCSAENRYVRFDQV